MLEKPMTLIVSIITPEGIAAAGDSQACWQITKDQQSDWLPISRTARKLFLLKNGWSIGFSGTICSPGYNWCLEMVHHADELLNSEVYQHIDALLDELGEYAKKNSVNISFLISGYEGPDRACFARHGVVQDGTFTKDGRHDCGIWLIGLKEIYDRLNQGNVDNKCNMMPLSDAVGYVKFLIEATELQLFFEGRYGVCRPADVILIPKYGKSRYLQQKEIYTEEYYE